MTEILISFIAGLAFSVGVILPPACLWAVVYLLVTGVRVGKPK